jgi:ACR3 family arsenite transporter
VTAPGLNLFARYLTLWVALGIVAGVALGRLSAALEPTIGRPEVAHANRPVGVLIWR